MHGRKYHIRNVTWTGNEKDFATTDILNRTFRNVRTIEVLHKPAQCVTIEYAAAHKRCSSAVGIAVVGLAIACGSDRQQCFADHAIAAAKAVASRQVIVARILATQCCIAQGVAQIATGIF